MATRPSRNGRPSLAGAPAATMRRHVRRVLGRAGAPARAPGPRGSPAERRGDAPAERPLHALHRAVSAATRARSDSASATRSARASSAARRLWLRSRSHTFRGPAKPSTTWAASSASSSRACAVRRHGRGRPAPQRLLVVRRSARRRARRPSAPPWPARPRAAAAAARARGAGGAAPSTRPAVPSVETTRPFSPSTIASDGAPRSETIAGTPRSSASRATSENVSAHTDGTTSASTSARIQSRSSRRVRAEEARVDPVHAAERVAQVVRVRVDPDRAGDAQLDGAESPARARSGPPTSTSMPLCGDDRAADREHEAAALLRRRRRRRARGPGAGARARAA